MSPAPEPDARVPFAAPDCLVSGSSLSGEFPLVPGVEDNQVFFSRETALFSALSVL